MAAQAEDWQIELVRAELIRASDVGERRSNAQLQEACGMGSGDLAASLEALRVAGEAFEEAPGEWGTVPEGVREARDAAAAEPAPEEPGAAAVGEGDGPLFPSLAEAERAAGRGAPSAGGRVPSIEKVVELPVEVADALDEAALGKMVKAGIEAAKADRATFVLRVNS